MIVGITSVVGDFLHPGHIAMLNECRAHCDYLICLVMAGTDDRPSKNRPIQSLFERSYQVANTKACDEIYACSDEADLLLALKILRPFIDIRFVGEDYKDTEFTGRAFCEESGVEIYYTQRLHGLSSSELRNRIKNG